MQLLHAYVPVGCHLQVVLAVDQLAYLSLPGSLHHILHYRHLLHAVFINSARHIWTHTQVYSSCYTVHIQ
jgi:hypothetical protein